MNLIEIVEMVRERFADVDTSNVPGVLAFQFNVLDRKPGTFYVEIKDGVVSVEPYEYCDRNAIFSLKSANLVKMIEGKLDPVLAFTTGRLKVDGDIGAALEITKFLKQ